MRRMCYAICTVHGAGGGFTIGAGPNKVTTFASAIDGLDLIITGHTHKPITFPLGRLLLDPQHKTIKQRNMSAVTCSSFLNPGGYALEKMYQPVGRCETVIHLSGFGRKIDVSQSTTT